MTGEQFKQFRKQLGNLREAAEQLGVSKSTLQREEQKDKVRRLYAAAILWETQDSESQTTQTDAEI
jgi:hypothetical protein